MIRILFLSLVLAGAAHAGATTEVAPDDDGALYAPNSLTVSADETGSLLSSYYSTAQLNVIDIAHPGDTIDGADLFINDQYVGKSPLNLTGYLMNTPTVSVSATREGYSSGFRPAVRLPEQGKVNIAMASDNAANFYTLPAFAVGLAMLGGAAVAYGQDTAQSSQVGLALVCGAAGVIVVSQIIAHFFHLPRLRKSVRIYNEKPEPMP